MAALSFFFYMFMLDDNDCLKQRSPQWQRQRLSKIKVVVGARKMINNLTIFIVGACFAPFVVVPAGYYNFIQMNFYNKLRNLSSIKM